MADSSVNVTEGSGKRLRTHDRTVSSVLVQEQVVLVGEPPYASYVVGTASAVSTATGASHLLQIMAGSSLNVYVKRIRVWQYAVATTAAIVSLQLFRLATAGTGGTSITPSPVDGTDSASGATSMTLPTAKGTEGTLVGIAASQFIQTVPTGGTGTAALLAEWDFDELRAKSIRIPAGTSNGLAIKNPSAVAGASVVVEAWFTEASY